MSRIGRKPVAIPSGVNVAVADGNFITVTGPKGELSYSAPTALGIELENGNLVVSRPNDARENRSLHGLSRTLISNMVIGVTDGFRKNLEIQGVGYRAAMDGKDLILNVGFSHPVRFSAPEGITYALDGQTKVSVTGIDKQAVGEEAARIRRVRPPEPYKGKGIRYEGEVVRRK